jgi:iron-only hydrogenase group A
MSKFITISVNNKNYSVEAGLTIMQALDGIGFRIPRLCYHPKLSVEGVCRVCLVEIEGWSNFATSCNYRVAEGMKIWTNTNQIRRTRRDIVELILDNHPDDCHTCERDGDCELQRLAHSVGIEKRLFEGEKKSCKIDLSSPAIVRDANKCILCGKCVRLCREIQKVAAIDYSHRGFQSVVMTAYDMPIGESVCITCGQCIMVCPTAALLEKNYTEELFEGLSDKKKLKVVQFAPAVRAAIGEAFGLKPGRQMEKEFVAGLRKLGFDVVFDTQFGADLTVMEEASEFLERLTGDGVLPMITSCSSAWIKYLEQFHPEMIPHTSTCKAPMSTLGTMIKTYYARKKQVSPQDILSVAIMPCTTKKFEIERDELKVNGMKTVDIVVTTREIAWMLKSAGIDFLNIKGEEFDSLLGSSSGASTIFGVTGGMIEAALRTAYELYTGETLVDIEFSDLRGFKGIKEASIKMGDKNIRIAAAHGLGNAHALIEIAKKEPSRYHFIEIMSCPGGCIGGGGQPYAEPNSIPLDEELFAKRADALYGLDRGKSVRRSHENPEIQQLYREFLGRPLSPLSHKLLHTHYKKRFPQGVVPQE